MHLYLRNKLDTYVIFHPFHKKPEKDTGLKGVMNYSVQLLKLI